MIRQLAEPNEVDVENRARVSQIATYNRQAWKWLADSDQAMVELASRGTSHRLIAAAVGLSPGTVSRRLSTIHDRLRSPETRCLLDPACPLPDVTRKIALLSRVTGLATRQIGKTLGLSHMSVREHIRYASGVLRMLTSRMMR